MPPSNSQPTTTKATTVGHSRGGKLLIVERRWLAHCLWTQQSIYSGHIIFITTACFAL
jgi:hypothetical protein